METGSYRKIENDLQEAYRNEAIIDNAYNNNIVAVSLPEGNRTETIAEVHVNEGKNVPKLVSEETREPGVENKKSKDTSTKLIREYLQDSSLKNLNDDKIIKSSVEKIKDTSDIHDHIEPKEQTSNVDNVTTINNGRSDNINNEEEAQSLISCDSYLDAESKEINNSEIVSVKISDESASANNHSVIEKENNLKISKEDVTQTLVEASVSNDDNKTNIDNDHNKNSKLLVTLKELITVDGKSTEETDKFVEVNNSNTNDTDETTTDDKSNYKIEEKVAVESSKVKNGETVAVDSSNMKNQEILAVDSNVKKEEKPAAKSSVFSNIVQRLFSKVSLDSNSNVKSENPDDDDEDKSFKNLEKPITDHTNSAESEISVVNSLDNLEVEDNIINSNQDESASVVNVSTEPQIVSETEIVKTLIINNDNGITPVINSTPVADESKNYEPASEPVPVINDSDNVNVESVDCNIKEVSNVHQLVADDGFEVKNEDKPLSNEEDVCCKSTEYSGSDSDKQAGNLKDKKPACFGQYLFIDDEGGQVTNGDEVEEVVNNSEGAIESTEGVTCICDNSPIVYEDSEQTFTAVNNSVQSENITLNIKILVQTNGEGSENVHTEAFSRRIAVKRTVCSVCTCIDNNTIEKNNESIDQIVVDETQITTDHVTVNSEDATNASTKPKKKLQKKKNRTNLFQFFKALE